MGTATMTGPAPESGDLTAAGVAAEQAAHRGDEAIRRGHGELTALMRGGLGAAMASSRTTINGVQALNAELIGFVQGRVRHGLAHGRSLAACGSGREVLELQAAYVSDTLRAYVDELARLGELTGRLMNDCWAPLAQGDAATAGAVGARRAAS